MVGKMPAAAMGDMHLCPMATPGTPPIPHVGGPITLGSTGVFIGKKPAGRLGDLSVCVGPPSSVLMGCPTVMIGEVSSGSQAGSAGSAAAAAAASTKGPKSVNRLEPPPKAPDPAQAQSIEVSFTDASGRPLPAVWFRLEDPDGRESLCTTDMRGEFRRGGCRRGAFKIEVPTLSQARFSNDAIRPGDRVKLQVDCTGFGDGTEVHFRIEAMSADGMEAFIGTRAAKVRRGRAEVEWSYRDHDLEACGPAGAAGVESFRFVALTGFFVALSATARREPSEDRPIRTRAPLVSM